MPLLLLAFNVNHTGKVYDKLSSRLRETSVRAFKTPMKISPDEAGALKIASQNTGAQLSSSESQIPKLRFFKDLLLYVTAVLPISEIRFGCILLTEGLKTTTDNLSTGSSVNLEWKVRGAVKLSAIGAFRIVRVLAVPVWICILSIEFLVVITVCAILFPFFDINFWTWAKGWCKESPLFHLKLHR